MPLSLTEKVIARKRWKKTLAECEDLLSHHQNNNTFKKYYSSNTSFSKEELLEKIDMLKALVAAADKEIEILSKDRKAQRELCR